jgi:tetratricopeptide (TPR) repeat protein
MLACILWLTVLAALGKNDDEILIGQPEIGPLFAAQYRYYQSQSAGSVSVQNNSQDNLYAEANVTVTGYAPRPITTAIDLLAGGTTHIPVRIDFNRDKLPAEGGPLALEAEIELRVYSPNNEQLLQRQLPAKFQLHNLHRLPDDPPEAIAVFIDPGDQSLAEFTQTGKASTPGTPRTLFVPDNAQTAQELFELMKNAGIICVEQAAQTVRYPGEVLRTKIGSSYDCALLYAALLENANVPVALMVSDDYILVLLQQQDGQIAEQQPQESVSWKDNLWIPVDIRELKETFPEARAAGMQAYEHLEREGKADPFMLREVWERYKPVKFISSQSVKEMQLGITYVERGELEKAEQVFNKHLDSDARAAAHNNLGNVSLLNSEYQEAVSRYVEAIKADPDGAIYLNLGIAYFIAGENKATEMFDRAYNELGSYAQMCYALGIKLDGLEHKKVRSLLRKAEARALQSRTRPLGTRAIKPGEKLPLYWKRQ